MNDSYFGLSTRCVFIALRNKQASDNLCKGKTHSSTFCVEEKLSSSLLGFSSLLPSLLLTWNSYFWSSNVWGFFPPQQEILWDTSWLSDNLTQFWFSLPGDSIKSHRLKAVPQKCPRCLQRTVISPVIPVLYLAAHQ